MEPHSSNREMVKLITQGFLQNPYPVLTVMREQTPAFPFEANGFRMWVVTRDADIRRIFKEESLRKDVVATRRERVIQSMVRPDRKARAPARSRRSLLDRDGEDHRRLRDLVRHAFQPHRLQKVEARVRELARQLAQELPSEGIVDVHAQFALPLAASIMAEIAGIPEEFVGQFPPLVSAMLTGGSVEEVESAGKALYQLSLRLIERKRSARADDLFTQLLDAHAAGKMDDDELASMMLVLMIGGLEPATAICNGVMLLLQHPEQRARLEADPGLLPSCVEEVVRFESPFRFLPPRYGDKAIELGDVTIPAGEMIIVSVASANRDPAFIDDGDRFDIARQRTHHLSFGLGVHQCLGAALGRIETGEGIAAFFRRFPNAALAVTPEQIRWRPSTFLRRVDSLPVDVAGQAPRADAAQMEQGADR